MSIEVPVLRTMKSYAVKCSGCHRHLCTVAQFTATDWLGNDHHCPTCGCTSVKFEAGRSIGKKHRDWDWLFSLWSELYPVMRMEVGFMDMFMIETVKQA